MANNNTKHSQEYVEDYFLNEGYVVLDTYKGLHNKIKVRHSECGHEYFVSFAKFKGNRRCPKCNRGLSKTKEDVIKETINKKLITVSELDKEVYRLQDRIKLKSIITDRIFETTISSLFRSKFEDYKKYSEDDLISLCDSLGFAYLGNFFKPERKSRVRFIKYKCNNGHTVEHQLNKFAKSKKCKDCNASIDNIDILNETLCFKDLQSLSIINDLNCNLKYDFIDSYGYKYKLRLSSVLKIKKLTPFVKANPYVLENIKLYLSKEDKDNILISDSFINSTTPLLFKYVGENNRIKEEDRYFYCNILLFITKNVRNPNLSRSKVEDVVYNFLLNNNIEFEPQYTFNDCVMKRKLRFDFAIFNDNRHLKFLLELDGEFHYNIITMKNVLSEEKAKYNLQVTQQRDSIKNEYCKVNNIKLIRIPYWEFKNIETILTKELQLEVKNE